MQHCGGCTQDKNMKKSAQGNAKNGMRFKVIKFQIFGYIFK